MNNQLLLSLMAMSYIGCQDSASKETDTCDKLPDHDEDGYDSSLDCDDTQASIHPQANEVCDGLDNNCDGNIDEGVQSKFFVDVDGDGFGNAAIFYDACTAPPHFVADASDCDDSNATVYPNASDTCDGLDNNCDGVIDEGTSSQVQYYADTDGDGFGDPNNSVSSCAIPSGYVANSEDCDDNDATVSPQAVELCDNADNDCDGIIDNPNQLAQYLFYLDADADGYGGATTVMACSLPAGHSIVGTDCNDNDSLIHPASDEFCDGIDNNCDGSLSDTETDGDGDSFISCSIEGQWFGDSHINLFGIDCDDSNAGIYPGANETCDGIDNNCNYQIDEGATIEHYEDADGDGYGAPNTLILSCNLLSGYADNGNDCDDTDERTFPGAANRESDTLCMTDADFDGFGDSTPANGVTAGQDCNDSDCRVRGPSTPECVDYGTEIDNNCDGFNSLEFPFTGWTQECSILCTERAMEYMNNLPSFQTTSEPSFCNDVTTASLRFQEDPMNVPLHRQKMKIMQNELERTIVRVHDSKYNASKSSIISDEYNRFSISMFL